MYLSLSRNEFHSRFGNVYQAVYSGRDAHRASFRNDGWKFLLTTKRFLDDRRRFDALSKAIGIAGDDEIIVTEVEGDPPHNWTAVLSCDYESYISAMKSDELGWLLCVNKGIFGRSAKWAAIEDEAFHLSTGYTIFGGESAIVDKWAELLGGMDSVRRGFSTSFDLPGDLPALSSETKAALLAEVGW